EDVADRAPVGRQPRIVAQPDFAVDLDAPRCCALQSGQRSQKQGLARTRWAEYAGDAACREPEIDVQSESRVSEREARLDANAHVTPSSAPASARTCRGGRRTKTAAAWRTAIAPARIRALRRGRRPQSRPPASGRRCFRRSSVRRRTPPPCARSRGSPP